MRYTSRTKEAELRRFIELNQEHKQVLIVSGARQVGKTTLIDHVLSEAGRQFIKIDLEKTRSFAEKIDQTKDFIEFEKLLGDELSFSPNGRTVLFIDESQTSRRIGQYVRFMKESWNFATVIMSGSLIGDMHGENDRSPVGREQFLELWPFSFKEFLLAVGHDSLVETLQKFNFGHTIPELTHRRLMEDYDVYLNIGGLPGVIGVYKNKGKWRDALIDIYKTCEDDFIRYFGIKNTNLFGRALRAVSANAGSPSKNSQIIKVDAPGYKRIPDILAKLELWQLIIKVEQTGKAPEQLNFPPKRYLYDSGMLNYLRFRGRPNFSLSEVDDMFLKTAMGGLVENAVAISLRNQTRELAGVKPTKDSEIDFTVKFGNAFIPVECKAARKFKLYHASSLVGYCKLFKLHHGILLSLDAPLDAERNGIHIHSLPVYLADEISRLVDKLQT